MEERDTIIEFKRFENTIDASIAKTKLDAYGIPCFLTEENLANLYPSQSYMLFGVRLHLFSNDAEQAGEILREQLITETEAMECPSCHSKNIGMDYSRKWSSRATTLIIGLLFFIGFPVPKVYRCQICEHEF